MLEHPAPAIDGFVTATVAPVSINRLEPEAATTLLIVDMTTLIIGIDHSRAPIAPEHGEEWRHRFTQCFRGLGHANSVQENMSRKTVSACAEHQHIRRKPDMTQTPCMPTRIDCQALPRHQGQFPT